MAKIVLALVVLLSGCAGYVTRAELDEMKAKIDSNSVYFAEKIKALEATPTPRKK